MTTPRFSRARTRRSAVAVACFAIILGCEKRAEAPDANLSPAARATLEETLAAYEELRSALANDDASQLSSLATRLSTAAERAGMVAPESLRPTLRSLASSAESLGEVPREDIAAARRAFGEVSRLSMALLESDGSLRTGRYVYECTMTEGYGTWIQTTEEVSNPYQGSKMLRCGTEVEW